MKRFMFVLAAGIASASAQAAYLARMADSFIRRGVDYEFGYSEATLYLGIEAAYNLTRNVTIYDWYQGQIDEIVVDDGTIVDWDYSYYSLDEYRMGHNYIYWYLQTGENKYKSAADIVRNQMNGHPRTPTGGFWHRKPTYPDQMWLDGIFMADSFYAKWTNLFDADNTTAWGDIVLQFDNIESHTRNSTTGLLVHGYDESKTAVWADPVTGAAPLVWDRAVGWYFLALLELLQLFPEFHEGYSRLLGYFTTLASVLKTAQDESGGWWLIMSEQYVGAKGNYVESSATAMFTLGWLKGIRLGFLGDEYLDAAKVAYTLLTDQFVVENSDGTLNWEGTVSVGSLGSNGTYEYYISVALDSNDFKGAGPFMLAAYEWETWASNA
ncbi:cell wall glycosyl hydrolase YteR [Xylariales sp. AK1849]|nr:cell wall glycosyl hydrolase YteR [Xylariales sp. AK1849]